jgi:2-keto-3-deoxy-L-rhamnonate aldolase RhmA
MIGEPDLKAASGNDLSVTRRDLLVTAAVSVAMLNRTALAAAPARPVKGKEQAMTSPRPEPRDFRKRVLAREPVLGTFMKFTVPQPTEILGQIGYDFVMLDEEHSPWTREQLGHAYLGAMAYKTAAIVRISRPDAASILSVLDDGAIGIMVPHVDSAQKARDVASWSRYKGGTRGSGVSRGGDYGGMVGPGGIATVIAMIEDAEAIDNIDEITAVEGIDAFFLGRGDLGLSLSNVKGARPTLDEAVKKAAEAVLRNGKALAAVTSMGSDDAKAMADLGCTVMLAGNDQAFLRAGATAQLNNFRQLMKGGSA